MTNTAQDFENKARPLAESLIEYATEEGKQYNITDVKISISANDELETEVEKGKIARNVAGTTHQVTVTLYSDDRVMGFTKNTLDEYELRSTIDQNMQAIHIVPENSDKRLLDADKLYTGAKQDLNLYDATPPSQDTLLTYAKDVEAAAMAVDGTKTTRSVSISKDETHSLILATNGLDIQESKTMYSAGASVIAEDDDGMKIDGEMTIARHFSDLSDATELGKQAGENAVSKLGATLPDTGEYPIVLDNDAAQGFFSSVFSAIDGTAVYQGATFMKDKLGQQVMNESVTIVDNPRLEKGRSSRVVDTAGLECNEITFIKDGILESFNVSLMEARQLDIEPIGRENGRTNSRVLPGKDTPEELMSDIKEGIYIKGFNGGTVKINDGTYSRQAYGNLIKDGKVTDTAVEGFVVSGNLKEMFMDLSLANDTPEQPESKYSLAAPTTRINGITIAGK